MATTPDPGGMQEPETTPGAGGGTEEPMGSPGSTDDMPSGDVDIPGGTYGSEEPALPGTTPGDS